MMENKEFKPTAGNEQTNSNGNDAKNKVKENKYTPEESKFADGEGTQLDEAIDGDELDPATRGE